MTILQDTFTDTNGTALSSHTGDSGVTYTRHASFTVATITIEDNRAAKDTDAATAVYYADNITDPKFFEVEFVIVDKSNVSRSTGISAGMDTASDTAIIFRRQNATTWQLLTIIAGTPSATLLSASETFSAEAQHTLKLRRIPETNDYECFVDNVSLGVVTIADAEFLDTGKIGIRATNSQGAGVGYHLDNLSVSALSAPRALHRGRYFSLFDDDEVNRAEFWPAVVAATFHERSAVISATANIASSGIFFTVFERAGAVDAVADIATAGMSERERSVSLSVTADISTSGSRVVDRSVSINAAASIESSGESFTIFESSATLSVSASVESSAISFSVFESAASVAASASIEVAGVRVVDRSASLEATAAIESSATSFSVLNRVVQIDAVAAIESSAESFSVPERQSSIEAVAAIAVTRQVELSRSVGISAVADIAVTGGVEGGVFEHERSAALSATGGIESSAISFSIIQSASAFAASASITVNAQRESQRSVTISATAGIESSGEVDGAVIHRAASFIATATITASATFQHPTSPRRTFVVESERRIITVPVEDRVYITVVEDREVLI